MISAGEVGARFVVEDMATPILERISGLFAELDASIRVVKEQLGTFAAPGLSKTLDQIAGLDKSVTGLNTRLGGLDTRLTDLGGSAAYAANELVAGFGRAATAADTSFTAIDTAAATTSDALRGVKAQLAEIAAAGAMPKAAAEAATMVPMAAGGAGGRAPPGIRARGTGGHGGGPHLTASPVALPGGVHASGGLWETIGVAAGLDAWKHVLDAGGELQTQQKLLHDLLGSREMPGDIKAATDLAINYATDATKGIIGSTPAENLAGIREIYPFMPDLKAAEQSLPALMQSAKLLEEMTHGKVKAVDQLPILAKAIENLGGGINPETHELDPTRVTQAINEATKTIIAGGGVIDANALFGFAKQAGGMGRINTDLGKLFDGIMTSILDMGGPRAGTALAALGRQFLGDKMTAQTAIELTNLDILPKGSWEKAGAGIAMLPGFKMKGEDEIKDPAKGMMAWMNDVLGPAVKAKFGEHETVADLMQESYKIFGQQTGQRLGLLYLQNLSQIERDVLIRNSINPVNAYQGMVNQDYGANLNNLGAAISGFSEVLGLPEIPVAISSLQGLSAAVHAATTGLAALQSFSPPLAKVAVPLTPSMIEGAWDAAKDLGGAMSRWWYSSPAAPATTEWLKGLLWAPIGAPSAPPMPGGLPAGIPDAAEAIAHAARAGAAPPGMDNPIPGVAAVPPGISTPLDQGVYERSKRNSDLFRADPEAAHARALGAMIPDVAKIGGSITGSIQGLPSQVEPAIHTAFASIGSALSSAIASMAESAKAAAGAIPTGGAAHQVTTTTILQVSGRKMAEVVSSEQISANRSVNNSASFDGTSMPAWTDMQSYA